MAFRYHEDFLSVRSTPLTRAGSEVEKALRFFKQEARARAEYFLTGHTEAFPDLKICAIQPGGQDCYFQYPYANVKEMYELAEQSQVGTITNTTFRLDARKSKELSNIEELNPAWKDKVTSVCEEIRQSLAPGASKVTATLYKLLLYREGDFFDIHQDAQHSDRMFATLLFFLPVDHDGGEFCLFEHGNFRNSSSYRVQKSSMECTWVSFYTDVRHKVNKVTNGHRVVLNYSLHFEGSMLPWPIPPSLSPTVASAVTDYFTFNNNKVLALPLAYYYTLATLSPDFLKGIDAYVYSAISQVAKIDLQFVIKFDKTKIIPAPINFYNEDDYELMFQGVFTVHHDLAKKFFDITSESERELNEIEGDEDGKKKYLEISSKRDSQYKDLLKLVRDAQKDFDVEWIVQRNREGDITDFAPRLNIVFRKGEGKFGWLGNTTPAEEYYYVQAAMILHKKC